MVEPQRHLRPVAVRTNEDPALTLARPLDPIGEHRRSPTSRIAKSTDSASRPLASASSITALATGRFTIRVYDSAFVDTDTALELLGDAIDHRGLSEGIRR